MVRHIIGDGPGLVSVEFFRNYGVANALWGGGEAHCSHLFAVFHGIAPFLLPTDIGKVVGQETLIPWIK